MSIQVEDYFARLDAPRGKRLFWFEHSAHDLYREEPERMQRHGHDLDAKSLVLRVCDQHVPHLRE